MKNKISHFRWPKSSDNLRFVRAPVLQPKRDQDRIEWSGLLSINHDRKLYGIKVFIKNIFLIYNTEMKFIIAIFSFFFILGCATTNLHSSGNRRPSEATRTDSATRDNSTDFVEKTIKLYPNLEIPPGSYFKKTDIKIEKETCEVDFKKGEFSRTTNYSVDAKFGLLTGVTNSLTGVYKSSTSLPDPCPDNICEYETEYLGAPYNGMQLTKIWLDPYFKTVTRMETEFRRGPPGMKFENMALQLKYTCTPEFVGM